MGGTLLYALRMAITMAGCVVMLFFTSVKLTVLALACMPVGAPADRPPRPARAAALARRAGPRGRRLRATSTRRCTRSAPCRRSRTRRSRAPPSASAWRRCSRPRCSARAYLALLIAAVIVLAFGAVGLLLWVGAHDVLRGRLSAGGLTAFIFYAVIVANATFVLAEVYGELQRAAGASERLLELLATGRAHPRAGESARPAGAGRGPRRVRGRHLPLPVAARHARRSSASRSPWRRARWWRSWVRRARARPPCSSCCCASTIPQSGRVRLDGVDAREADPQGLRRRVAVVPQDPVIFAASVVDNVRYGRPEASDGEVREALPPGRTPRFRRTPAGRARHGHSASAA